MNKLDKVIDTDLIPHVDSILKEEPEQSFFKEPNFSDLMNKLLADISCEISASVKREELNFVVFDLKHFLQAEEALLLKEKICTELRIILNLRKYQTFKDSSGHLLITWGWEEL